MLKILTLAASLCLLLAAPVARAGTDPADACKASKARATGKKAADLLKAFGKNIKKLDPIKLSSSVSKAQSKLTKGFGKAEAQGSCLTTGDVTMLEATADAFVLDSVGMIDMQPVLCGNDILDAGEQCDGTDASACPGLCLANCVCPTPVCGNGSKEAGEECEPPGIAGGDCAGSETCSGFCECEPTAVCDCGSTTPAMYSFTSKPPVAPTCGTTDGSANPALACAGLYIGGGSGGLPVPSLVPDEGQLLFSVDFCNGTNLGLRHTNAVETGSARTCTGSGCLFGAPLPILDTSITVLSACVVNTTNRDAIGGVDCATGRTFIDQPVDSRQHATGGDQSPTTPGYQPCPICVASSCEGGPNDGMPCTAQSTPYDSYTCCDGGVDSSTPCVDNSECTTGSCVAGCSVFPTTHDCPPDPLTDVGVIPVPFALTTGTDTATADANGTFCGFCRDVSAESSDCFEGNPDPSQAAGCPDSTVIACEPASMGDVSGCGDAVPCRADADCRAPYETCEQRHPGAFRDATVTTFTETGLTAGDLRDWSGHAATVSSAFCIQSSFVPAIDVQGDVGGPGALSLPGESRLLSPSGAFVDLAVDVLH
jgi:hypothetical protein